MSLEIILGFFAGLFRKRIHLSISHLRRGAAVLLGMAFIGILVWLVVANRPPRGSGPLPTVTLAASPLASGHSPVILSLQTRKQSTSFAGTMIMAEFHFKDEDGDVSQLAFSLVQSTVSGVALQPEPVNISVEDQRQGATLTVEWDCQGTAAMVLFKAVLLDEAGHRSNLVPLLFDCG